MCDLYCSADEMDPKVATYANTILEQLDYVSPRCETGFVVFMSWLDDKVLVTQ